MVTEALEGQDCNGCLQLYGKPIVSNLSRLSSCDLVCTGNCGKRKKLPIFNLQKAFFKMHPILNRRKSIRIGTKACTVVIQSITLH